MICIYSNNYEESPKLRANYPCWACERGAAPAGGSLHLTILMEAGRYGIHYSQSVTATRFPRETEWAPVTDHSGKFQVTAENPTWDFPRARHVPCQLRHGSIQKRLHKLRFVLERTL